MQEFTIQPESAPGCRTAGLSTALAILALITLSTLSGLSVNSFALAEPSAVAATETLPDVGRRLTRAARSYLDGSAALERSECRNAWARYEERQVAVPISDGQLESVSPRLILASPAMGNLPPPRG